MRGFFFAFFFCFVGIVSVEFPFWGRGFYLPDSASAATLKGAGCLVKEVLYF